jgi:hypothetical protein
MPTNHQSVYSYRTGHHVKGRSPQEVGQSLEDCRVRHGSLTAENLLTDATDANHPLHEAFEWDDGEAAKQHRLHQARRLIVSVRIVSGPIQRPVPAFVSVRTPESGREYLPVQEALSRNDVKLRVLDDVKKHLETLERKYAHFAEAIQMLEELKKKIS